MLNTTVMDGGNPPTVSNVDSNITEGSMGRLASFQSGMNATSTLNPPRVTPPNVMSPIK